MSISKSFLNCKPIKLRKKLKNCAPVESRGFCDGEKKNTQSQMAQANTRQTRSQTRVAVDEQANVFMLTLRSTIRGLDSLRITIPRYEDNDDESSDYTYVDDETESVSSGGSAQVDPSKLEMLVLRRENCPDEDCAVCLEAFKPRQHCRRLHCGHIFHKRCADRWLVRTPQCPLCRLSIQQEPRLRVRVLRPRAS